MINYLSSKYKKYFAELALLFATVLWSGTFVIVKSGLSDSSAMIFIAIRFAIAGLILLPIVIKKRKLYTRKSILSGIFLGTLLFSCFATQTIGLKYITATKCAFITGAGIITIPFFQILIQKKLPTLGVLIGAVFVFVGITFLSSSGGSVFQSFIELGNNFGLGESLTLACAIIYSLYMVFLDMISSKHEFWVILPLQIITISILGFLFSFIFTIGGIEPVHFNLTGNLIIALLYTSIFATIITTSIQTKMQKEVTPTKAGIIFAFEPIFAAIFAFFIINEKISNFGYIGSLLIFSGLIISEVYDSLRKTDGAGNGKS